MQPFVSILLFFLNLKTLNIALDAVSTAAASQLFAVIIVCSFS